MSFIGEIVPKEMVAVDHLLPINEYTDLYASHYAPKYFDIISRALSETSFDNEDWNPRTSESYQRRISIIDLEKLKPDNKSFMDKLHKKSTSQLIGFFEWEISYHGEQFSIHVGIFALFKTRVFDSKNNHDLFVNIVVFKKNKDSRTPVSNAQLSFPFFRAVCADSRVCFRKSNAPLTGNINLFFNDSYFPKGSALGNKDLSYVVNFGSREGYDEACYVDKERYYFDTQNNSTIQTKIFRKVTDDKNKGDFKRIRNILSKDWNVPESFIAQISDKAYICKALKYAYDRIGEICILASENFLKDIIGSSLNLDSSLDTSLTYFSFHDLTESRNQLLFSFLDKYLCSHSPLSIPQDLIFEFAKDFLDEIINDGVNYQYTDDQADLVVDPDGDNKVATEPPLPELPRDNRKNISVSELTPIFEGELNREAMSEALIIAMRENELSLRKTAELTGTHKDTIINIRSGKGSVDKACDVLEKIGYRVKVTVTPRKN